MGEIKSALEIALERTKSVVGKKEAVEAEKFKKEGKVLVSKFLNDPAFNLKEGMKAFKAKQLGWVKEGVFQVLLANLILPQDKLGLKRIKSVGEAFFSIIENKKLLGKLFSQLESFFEEYLNERERLHEVIRQQYMPRLKQKEEELSKKMGHPVNIDINSDPEFHTVLRKVTVGLEDKYGAVLSQVKNDLTSMFDSER